MEWIAQNVPNIVVLLALAIVLGRAARSVFGGGALDCSTCSGDCGSCGGSCENPKLKLSKEQLDRLGELDKKHEVAQ